MTTKRVFTPGRKLTSGAREFRQWKDWVPGDCYIGKYISKFTDDYGKDCFVFETVEAQFADAKDNARVTGKNLALNHNGMLAKAMADVQFNEYIQVVYTGKSKIEKGPYKGKDSHVLEVDTVLLDETPVEL